MKSKTVITRAKERIYKTVIRATAIIFMCDMCTKESVGTIIRKMRKKNTEDNLRG